MIIFKNTAYGKSAATPADTMVEIRKIFTSIEPEILSFGWYERELIACAETISSTEDTKTARLAIRLLLKQINAGVPTDSFGSAEFILVE